MEPEGAGTRYVARAIHGTASDRKKHEEMGFDEGWGKALDRLLQVAGELLDEGWGKALDQLGQVAGEL